MKTAVKQFCAPAENAAVARCIKHRRGRAAGFTLIEVLIASGVAMLLVAGCMAAIFIDQIAIRKAKEQALAMDFLTKYAENIKALPFTSVAPGLPINSLYNGANGAPLISIPANTNWVSLTNVNFQIFYPDLVWFANRNPQMQLNLKQNSVSGTLHDLELNVKVDWDSPLGKGTRLEVQVDFTRDVDVPIL